MPRYGLEVCRQKGLNEVILGCHADNAASIKTIENNGGILVCESDNYKQGSISKYYKITL